MNHPFIISYRELRVYQAAIDLAVQVFEHSQTFPPEERELLTVPLLRAAQLVCVYVAQAWLRRRYHSAFIATLNQAEAEAAATQVWLELAVLGTYLDAEVGQELHHACRQVLMALDHLIEHAAA
ncbi:four helix bundle protein [Stenomitos frigidus]|uniref:Four helix bundle protein n=1 Tax=Stenomitos frigidus ULC18 TaxID=2107698 RepID=A0A2T1E8R7_9CYAN|nr:four helix bundle protein [Stenomitos frigidus]PSB29103.1 four helix bundle protein [Stenomitos frigidus ULC18]